MTGATRRDVSAAGLRVRRVAAKAGDVGIRPRGNREPDAVTISPVTSGAGSVTVFRVIESRIETAQRWKRFDLSALNVRMTNRTNCVGRI